MKRIAALTLFALAVVASAGCSGYDHEKSVAETLQPVVEDMNASYEEAPRLEETASVGLASFSYPSGWAVAQDEEGMVQVKSPDSSSSAYLSAYKGGDDLSYEEVVEFADGFSSEAVGGKIGPLSATSVGELSGAEFDYRTEVSGVEYDVHVVVVFDGPLLYNFMIGYSSEDDLPTAQEILESLSIEKLT